MFQNTIPTCLRNVGPAGSCHYPMLTANLPLQRSRLQWRTSIPVYDSLRPILLFVVATASWPSALHIVWDVPNIAHVHAHIAHKSKERCQPRSQGRIACGATGQHPSGDTSNPLHHSARCPPHAGGRAAERSFAVPTVRYMGHNIRCFQAPPPHASTQSNSSLTRFIGSQHQLTGQL